MPSFPGLFWDGRTAARREVSVNPTLHELRIHAETGEKITAWPYEQTRIVRRSDGTRPTRLGSLTAPDARLVVADPAFLRELGQVAPDFKRLSGRRFDARRTAIWIGSVALLAMLITVLLPSLTGFAVQLIPREWEVAVGGQIVQYIAGDSRRCRAPAGEEALARLMDRLGGSPDAGYGFDVNVYDNAATNAFAAPGGHIAIYRGLLASAKSGDEVAGVLAHEMGHVVERHATRAIVRELGLAALLGLVTGTGKSQLGIDPGALGQAFLSNAYSQRAEQEADEFAVDNLNRADIRGDGFADFFERLAAMQGAGGGMRSTHPPSPNRASAARRAATGTRPAMSAADWQALRRICGDEPG